MKKATKEALIERYESQMDYLNTMIDLNFTDEEAVKQFQKHYRELAKLLSELLKIKTED